MSVVVVDVAMDGGLEINNCRECAALEGRLVRAAKNPSTGLSHEALAEPRDHLRVLVGGIDVADQQNSRLRRRGGSDGIEETEELLMAVALHVAADNASFEHVESGEQGGGALAFVAVGHGAGVTLLRGPAGLNAIQRLDLALLIEREHGRMGRRIDVRPWISQTLAANFGSFESLKLRMRCGAGPCAHQMRASRTD